MAPLRRASVRFVLAGLLAACGDAGPDDGEHAHQPSGAICDSSPAAPTYETFGRTFFATYCQSCHGASKTGAARMSAPVALTFDALFDIRRFAAMIDEHAAAGPAATNTAMPNLEPRPTIAERQKLGAWLACGAP